MKVLPHTYCICFLSLVTGDSLLKALLLGMSLDIGSNLFRKAVPVSTHISRLTFHIPKNSVGLQKAKMQYTA
jgi:hypothetical protein